MFYINSKGKIIQKWDVFFMNKKYEKYCYHKGDDSQFWIEQTSEKIEIRNINNHNIMSKKWVKYSDFYKGNSK